MQSFFSKKHTKYYEVFHLSQIFYSKKQFGWRLENLVGYDCHSERNPLAYNAQDDGTQKIQCVFLIS